MRPRCLNFFRNSSLSPPSLNPPAPQIETSSLDASPPASTQPRFAKAREWTKLIAITGSAQVVVQAIGFLCGILVIRWLSVEQYALYTITNTMLAAMTMLADGGIASGVMSEGGKVWQDKDRLGSVITTGIELRRKFGIVTFALTIPVLNYLLVSNGATILQGIAISLCVAPAFVATLTGSLLKISPQLHQNIQSLQKIDVSSNAWRLALNVLLLLSFPFASFAILATGLSQIYANWRLRKLLVRHATPCQESDPNVSKKIKRVVKRILPSTIYFCLSSQITIWIVSILGDPTQVARIGALGRISVILSIIVSLFATLVVPRFARLKNDARLLSSRFYRIIIGLVSLGAMFNLTAWAFPSLFLVLLGDKYSGLTILLRWSLAAATIGMLNQVASQLMNSRGLIIPPLVYIPFAILVQIAALSSQDLTKLEGVFTAAILSSGLIFLLRNVYFLLANHSPGKIAA